MKLRVWASALFAVFVLAVPVVSAAHTGLESSVPADKSQVAAVEKLELAFKDTVHFEALSLQRGASSATPVTPLPSEWASRFAIPVQALAAGNYTLEWKVSTDDGHVASGRIQFTVKAPHGPSSHY